MSKQAFITTRMSPERLRMIDRINAIIGEYQSQDYVLTVRQLYYQLVSRDVIENTVRSYKRIVDLVSQARLGGLLDWSAIEDRTRGLKSLSTWASPEEIVSACASQFRHDLWVSQDVRPEIWVEKEALAGVFDGIANELRVSYLSCRGYVSQSEMYVAASRIRRRQFAGQRTVILHFGDHDPSGIDMSRDLADRLKLMGASVEVRRLALNMDQIEEHDPPPNPAKEADARFAEYESEYGRESWELDALSPSILVGLARAAVLELRDERRWAHAASADEAARNQLQVVSDRWQDVVRFVQRPEVE